MPRKSPFEIVLSLDEQKALENLAHRYTAPYRDVVRAKIILLAAQGLENKTIAGRLDTPRQIVRKWRRRYLEEGRAGLDERPRRGRPRRFSPTGRL